MVETKRDPLDELFLTEEQSKWFNKGKEAGRVRERMEGRPKKNVIRKDKKTVDKLKEKIKILEKRIDNEKKKWIREQNKNIHIMSLIRPEINNKLFKKLQSIAWSGNKKYIDKNFLKKEGLI